MEGARVGRSRPLNYVTACDEAMVDGLLVSICSFVFQHRDAEELNVVVLDGGIEAVSWTRFYSAFKEWAQDAVSDLQVEICRKQVDLTPWKAFPPHWGSHAVYSSLDVLMGDYTGVVVFSDVDIAHGRSLWGEVEKTVEAKSGLGAVVDRFKRTLGDDYYVERLSPQIDSSLPYLNSGLLIVNREVFSAEAFSRFVNLLDPRRLEKTGKKRCLFDQTILNAYVAGCFEMLSESCNAVVRGDEDFSAFEEPACFHFVGAPKPWEENAFGMRKMAWEAVKAGLGMKHSLKDRDEAPQYGGGGFFARFFGKRRKCSVPEAERKDLWERVVAAFVTEGGAEVKRLSVIHVLASHAEYGGLEKNVIDLASSQAEQGHRVTVFVTEAMVGRFPESVRTQVLKLERSRRNPFLVRKLRKELQLLSPDIVHAHANKPAALVGKIKARLDCPIIATVQNLKRDQSMFHAFDRVICASQVVADSLGGKESRVIYNAVEPIPQAMVQRASEDQPPWLGESRLVLCAVGRFVTAKGYDILLNALAQMPEAVLWLIGDGPLRKELEEQVAELGLAERVWMPGFLDHGAGFMSLSDVFVISSRNEGGPYTLAEALRSGCPVVSTRVGYAPEFLSEGALCDMSVEGICAALESVQKDRSGFREKTQTAFRKAEKDLDLQTMVKGVEEVYFEALAE